MTGINQIGAADIRPLGQETAPVTSPGKPPPSGKPAAPANSGEPALPGTQGDFEYVDPIAQAAEVLNQVIGPAQKNTTVRIQLDEATNRYVIQSVDKVTGEVVQQYPTEEILRVIAFFRSIEGLAVDGKA